MTTKRRCLASAQGSWLGLLAVEQYSVF